MRQIRIAGFVLLLLLWIWLSQYLLRAGGFNLHNILVVVMSGIVIVVPLYKKYIRPADNEKKR